MGISKSEIKSIVEKQVKECKSNNFGVLGEPAEPMWGDAIVGFSRGGDPYYSFLKKDIWEFHWSPAEAFKLGKKGADVESKDLCIISVALPQTQKTKEDNASAVKDPAQRWLVSRGEWEKLITGISQKIVDELEEKGVEAVAIDLIKEFSRDTSEKYGIASKWSHRHAAFISGLGTFGHSDGLITKKGKAMRFTTILIKADIKADIKEYEKYNEWCKFAKDGSCFDCMKRCPVGAITKDGHDKEKCMKFLEHIKEKIVSGGILNPEYISGCGFCQTSVACQDGVPV